MQKAQRAIASAEHIVIFFPLWLGTMPALLKAFLEQVLRPGFANRHRGCSQCSTFDERIAVPVL